MRHEYSPLQLSTLATPLFLLHFVESFGIFEDTCTIYDLLSQRMPEYPGRHVQRYPVDLLTTHDPLFKHGEDEQLSTEKVIEIPNSSNC